MQVDKEFCNEVRKMADEKIRAMENGFDRRITAVETCVTKLDRLITEQQRITDKIIILLERMEENFSALQNGVTHNTKEIEEINSMPSKKWDKAINWVLGIIAAIIIGWAVYQINNPR